MQASREVVAHLPHGLPGYALIVRGVTAAFIDGFHRGCLVAGIVAIVVGFAVFQFLPKRVIRNMELVHQ